MVRQRTGRRGFRLELFLALFLNSPRAPRLTEAIVNAVAHRDYQWPIASFGSPGGHSLSVGTPARGPGPEIQWMLSPVTVSSPNQRIEQHRHRRHSSRSRTDGCYRLLELRRVVFLLVPPQGEHDGGDLTRQR